MARSLEMCDAGSGSEWLLLSICSGILYGFCVYLFMYGIVLRVSAIHSTRYPWSYPWPVLIGNVGIHTLGIGLTIALVTRYFSRKSLA